MIKRVLRNIRHMFMNQSSDAVIASMVLSANQNIWFYLWGVDMRSVAIAAFITILVIVVLAYIVINILVEIEMKQYRDESTTKDTDKDLSNDTDK